MFLCKQKVIKHLVLVLLLLALTMMLVNLYYLTGFINLNNIMTDVEDTAFYNYLVEGSVCSTVGFGLKISFRSVLRFLKVRSAFLLELLMAISFAVRIKKGYRTVEPLFCEIVKKMYLLSRVNFGKYKNGGLLIS